MERRREPETRRLVTVVILFCAMVIPLFAVGGCGKQLARMEENQVRLQALIAANARELATISAQLHTGQGKINESIQTLDGDTQQVAAGVTTVQNQQQKLHNTVAAGNEGLNRRIGSVQDNQRTLQGSVSQVSDVTQRTAADLTALGQQHTALHQMVQANQQQLTGSLGTVANNQQRIQTGIGDLRHANDGLAERLTSMAAKHDTMYATLQSNDQRMTERLAALSSSDRQICDDIANVHTFLQTVATNLATANAALKEQLGASHDNLTTQVAQLASNQQQLQTGVDTLGGKADQTAAQIVDTKSSLQETLKVSREVLTGQMAASLQNQQTLQGGVQSISDKADTLTENIGTVATGQATLHNTLRTNHDVVITAMAGLSDHDEALRTGVDKLDGKTDQVAGHLAALTAQQQSLYEAAKTNQDAVVARLADVSDTQTKLQAGVSDLSGKTDAIASAQNDVQRTLQSHSEATNAGVAGLAEGQRTLRTQVDAVATTAGQTARDVAALNNGQTALRQAVQTAEKNLGDRTSQTAADLKNSLAEQQAALQQIITAGHAVLTTHAAELTASQQALRNGIDNLGQATQRVASDVAVISTGQGALGQTLKAHSDKVNEQVATLANAQKEMKANLDTLTATAGQTALDVLALGNNQTNLTQTVKAGVADLGTRTDKLAAITSQASLDVLAVSNNQKELAQTVKTGVAELGTRTDKVATGLTAGQKSLNETLNRQSQTMSSQVAKVADGQQQIQNSLDTLTAVTGQASLDVLALGNNQKELAQTVKTGVADLGTRTDKVVNGQQQVQSGLDTLTATTSQTALDVLAMAAQQEAVRTALQSHAEASRTQMTKLADNQQQMLGSQDTVTAITGQASLDTLAMSNNQGQLAQAVQASRQEMAGRLTVLAREQQNWSGRLDAAQAKVATIAQSIAALEQQIAKLQEAMQAGLQGTTTALGATRQQRQQFETKVSQDIQAVIDSLAGLRQTQTSLQEQITQVQKCTQGQADSIRTVIDRMKATPAVNNRAAEQTPEVENPVEASEPKQPPAEFRISAAAEKPQAPAMAEAAK